MTCGDSSELPVYFFIPFVLVLLSYLWLPLTPSCSPPPSLFTMSKALNFPEKKNAELSLSESHVFSGLRFSLLNRGQQVRPWALKLWGVKGGSRTEETEAGSHSIEVRERQREGKEREGKWKKESCFSSPLEQLHLSKEGGEVSTEMLRVHLSCHLYSNCPLSGVTWITPGMGMQMRGGKLAA